MQGQKDMGDGRGEMRLAATYPHQDGRLINVALRI